MPSENQRDLPHIYLPDHGQADRFKSTGSGRPKPGPERDREAHAHALSSALSKTLEHADLRLSKQNDELSRRTPGFYLEFELSRADSDALQKLENLQGKKPIELVSVRNLGRGDGVAATVFVPAEKRDVFTEKLEQYRTEETDTGKPRHLGLVAFLENICIADAKSLFTGNPADFPRHDAEAWWEVWLRKEMRAAFEINARHLNIRLNAHHLKFVEREVILALASPSLLDRLIAQTDAIAELRLASDNPSVFMAMRPEEQREWDDDLANRVDAPPMDAPAVCILDSGSTLRHSLLCVALDPTDQHAYEPTWLVEDTSRNSHGGHGTEMSGLVLYGDLVNILEGSERVALVHRLESVKILPDRGQNEPELYGGITGASIAKAEIQAPNRPRVVCLAVTSPSDGSLGKPSSWSAALDQLAFESENQRLIMISAGNIREPLTGADYLHRNDLSPVENPAQAWNALTVGAYTDKTNITDPTYRGWDSLGACGDLSPCSRTSVSFDRKWPLKPDVVLEGGNLAVDPSTGRGDHVDDLALLTTFRRPEERSFTTTRDTSAATALAARMAARIMAERMANVQNAPWPETVRALMVHSAEWTERMRSHLPSTPRQQDWRPILCRYGYGVPRLARALHSLQNDVNLVIEKTFQPFYLDEDRVKTRDMVLHDLPWPRQELRGLGAADVEMRVTLSYFIEPNPGERGWTRRHRYASHGLRFAVKRGNESLADFIRRINLAAREEEESIDTSGNDGWLIGPRLRDRGSIHSDIWRGSAAELAAKHAVAVYPVGGWWKEKKYLERYNQSARYALIVSLRTLTDVTIDLYTPIIAQIDTPVAVSAEIQS